MTTHILCDLPRHRCAPAKGQRIAAQPLTARRPSDHAYAELAPLEEAELSERIKNTEVHAEGVITIREGCLPYYHADRTYGCTCDRVRERYSVKGNKVQRAGLPNHPLLFYKDPLGRLYASGTIINTDGSSPVVAVAFTKITPQPATSCMW
jgi:hypothetical protein